MVTCTDMVTCIATAIGIDHQNVETEGLPWGPFLFL
jgi:hypothetical protein